MTDEITDVLAFMDEVSGPLGVRLDIEELVDEAGSVFTCLSRGARGRGSVTSANVAARAATCADVTDPPVVHVFPTRHEARREESAAAAARGGLTRSFVST